MLNLEVDEQGRMFRRAGDLGQDCRLLIMDADGGNRRELRLRGLKATDLGLPSWP